VAGVGPAALLLSLADDPLVATAGRASLAVLALGALAIAVRRRGSAAPPPLALIEVAERRPLSRDGSVALLRVGGRTLLVGCGADGVRLISDLGPVRQPLEEP
jgi:flagellar biogenesis protein FliO